MFKNKTIIIFVTLAILALIYIAVSAVQKKELLKEQTIEENDKLQDKKAAIEGWVVYENDEYGVYVEHPSDWKNTVTVIPSSYFPSRVAIEESGGSIGDATTIEEYKKNRQMLLDGKEMPLEYSKYTKYDRLIIEGEPAVQHLGFPAQTGRYRLYTQILREDAAIVIIKNLPVFNSEDIEKMAKRDRELREGILNSEDKQIIEDYKKVIDTVKFYN